MPMSFIMLREIVSSVVLPGLAKLLLLPNMLSITEGLAVLFLFRRGARRVFPEDEEEFTDPSSAAIVTDPCGGGGGGGSAFEPTEKKWPSAKARGLLRVRPKPVRPGVPFPVLPAAQLSVKASRPKFNIVFCRCCVIERTDGAEAPVMGGWS